jgi:hypothetical protein
MENKTRLSITLGGLIVLVCLCPEITLLPTW